MSFDTKQSTFVEGFSLQSGSPPLVKTLGLIYLPTKAVVLNDLPFELGCLISISHRFTTILHVRKISLEICN